MAKTIVNLTQDHAMVRDRKVIEKLGDISEILVEHRGVLVKKSLQPTGIHMIRSKEEPDKVVKIDIIISV